MKTNCWQHKDCGREPGGRREHELGVCPAAVEKRLSGVHGGVNGGRACWVVPGTLCDVKLRTASLYDFEICTGCDFYNLVKEEEQHSFVFSGTLLTDMINGREHREPAEDPPRQGG